MELSIEERNQQNAMHSTGPKTPEGKARSSQNSLKFGIYSKTALLPTEDREEYLTYTQAMLADLRAVGPVQHELAQLISDNFWRVRRFRAIEVNQVARLAQMFLKKSKNSPTDITVAWADAVAWDEDCTSAQSLEKLGKHEQRLTNQIHKAMKLLKDLQREARELGKQKPALSGFVPHPPKTAPDPAAPTAESTAIIAVKTDPIPPNPEENPAAPLGDRAV